MAATRRRDEAGAARFVAYVEEVGLAVELRAICARHFVALREIYLDGKGPTTTAARLEAWHWLLARTGKTHGEVGRMFDRDPSSVMHAMRRLRAAARAMGAALDLEHAPTVARAVALEASSNVRRAGERAAAMNNARQKPIDET